MLFRSMCIDNVIQCHYNLIDRFVKEEERVIVAVLQVRVDEELKNQAAEILKEEGLDLSTAVRMFLKRVILERGFPFNKGIDEDSLKALIVLRMIQKHSEEIGISDMTLDEINEEIRLAREERRKRKEAK